MPALVEITLFEGNGWKDDDYNTWVDDNYNTWVDSDVTVKASHEAYAGTQYWNQHIIRFTSPQFRLDHASGGHCKLGFGDMVLALDTFQASGVWPPPESCPVVIKYADDAGTVHELFSGTLHRQSLSRDGIVYQLYERTFDALLLDEAEDYNGDVVAMPRAFGAILHQRPTRLPDSIGGNQVYHHGELSGTLHADWHVYDDGVDICANVENETLSTFELNTLPVGEVTVSGSGAESTLADVFSWACGSGRLNLSFNHALASLFSVAHWASSQEVMVAFLDRLAAYAGHLFYINSETLYLVSMFSDNGADIRLTENDFLPSSVTFAPPVAIVKTSWTERQAVEESIGKYIKEIEHTESFSGRHPYGDEERVDCFQTVRAHVQAALASIHGLITAPRWETSIPMKTVFPVPGQKIVALDESMGHAVYVVIRARDIEYDFENRIIKLAGEGVVS